MRTGAFGTSKLVRKTTLPGRRRYTSVPVAQAGFCEIYERITGQPAPPAICAPVQAPKSNIAKFLSDSLKQAPILEDRGPTIQPPANLEPPASPSTPEPSTEQAPVEEITDDPVQVAVEDYFAVEAGLESIKEASIEADLVAGLKDSGVPEAEIEAVAPEVAAEVEAAPASSPEKVVEDIVQEDISATPEESAPSASSEASVVPDAPEASEPQAAASEPKAATDVAETVTNEPDPTAEVAASPAADDAAPPPTDDIPKAVVQPIVDDTASVDGGSLTTESAVDGLSMPVTVPVMDDSSAVTAAPSEGDADGPGDAVLQVVSDESDVEPAEQLASSEA